MYDEHDKLIYTVSITQTTGDLGSNMVLSFQTDTENEAEKEGKPHSKHTFDKFCYKGEFTTNNLLVEINFSPIMTTLLREFHITPKDFAADIFDCLNLKDKNYDAETLNHFAECSAQHVLNFMHHQLKKIQKNIDLIRKPYIEDLEKAERKHEEELKKAKDKTKEANHLLKVETTKLKSANEEIQALRKQLRDSENVERIEKQVAEIKELTAQVHTMDGENRTLRRKVVLRDEEMAELKATVKSAEKKRRESGGASSSSESAEKKRRRNL